MAPLRSHQYPAWGGAWLRSGAMSSERVNINIFSIVESFNARVQIAFALGPKTAEKCLIHKKKIPENVLSFSVGKFFWIKKILFEIFSEKRPLAAILDFRSGKKS